MDIEISDAAELEFEESIDWYRDRSPQAAIEFVREVRDTLDRIADNPKQFGEVHQGLRRARVKRYPHGVFFRIGDAAIRVVAIMHGRRDPRKWQNRL